MQNFEDRAKLQDAEEAQFITACQDEFIEKSLAITNARKVRTLSAVSFLPNVVSGITAAFFVLFLLSGYPRIIALILGALLLIVVAAVEIGKRGLIAAVAKDFFVSNRVSAFAVIALCILVAVSMTASYQGGRQLITETGTPPPRAEHPELETLRAQLANQQETVSRLQRTTWKGKVTTDAVKGINQAKKIEAQLLERIGALSAADDDAHAELLSRHSGQKMNFGYLLGIVAALADAFLFGLLWSAKRLRYEVAAAHYIQSRRRAAPTGSSYLTGRDAITAAPPSLNQAERDRRPIGFHRYDPEDDDEDDAMRNAMRNASDDQDDATQCVTQSVQIEQPAGRIRGCAYCGEEFTARTTWHKFCSEPCKIAAWESRTGKKWRGKA